VASVKPLLPPDELARYADAMVRTAVAIGKDDHLIVTCEPAHREFGIALLEAGYRAGAKAVEVIYSDPLLRAARLRTAPERYVGYVSPWRAKRLRATLEPKTATLLVAGDGEPNALNDIDPKLLAIEQTAPLNQLPWLRRALGKNLRRWGIIAWPTEPWARQVYPNLKPEAAMRKLARDLMWFCRLGPEDPSGRKGLQEHLDAVRRRAGRLTKLKLAELELRAPGTELRTALHPEGLWLGGGEKNAHGIHISPNLPTEESFTTPIATSTEGTFRCTRPLIFQGRLIDGIQGEFHGGRLTKLKGKGRNGEFFREYIGSIKDADRLGEVALVDASSRIGRAGRVYYNTLLDENAAAHIAFGLGFEKSRAPGTGARGVNRSQTHVDVMIGSDDFEATGIDARGRRVPLIRDGAWQL
jgi:aminopeptidase